MVDDDAKKWDPAEVRYASFPFPSPSHYFLRLFPSPFFPLFSSRGPGFVGSELWSGPGCALWLAALAVSLLLLLDVLLLAVDVLLLLLLLPELVLELGVELMGPWSLSMASHCVMRWHSPGMLALPVDLG